MISIKISKICFRTSYLKLETQYHYSSTIVKGIGRAQKLVKINRQRPVVTKTHFKRTSLTTNFHDNPNEEIYVAHQEKYTQRHI